MASPRVPNERGDEIELPCGETIHARTLDLGVREFDCDCGAAHAVVMDVHPPSRFVPEGLVDVFREVIETEDDFGEFGTPHVMGSVLEEFPDRMVTHDASEDGEVGYALLWIAEFDSRRLHEIVVELLVELMDHAISHSEDPDASAAFDEKLSEFDVVEFVEAYRRQRDFDTASDKPV